MRVNQVREHFVLAALRVVFGVRFCYGLAELCNGPTETAGINADANFCVTVRGYVSLRYADAWP